MKTVDETVKELKTDLARGLEPEEAKRRLDEWGPNKLAEKPGKPLVLLFLEQLNDVLIYILLAAAIVSAALGEVSDAAIILVVVLVNAIVGVVQEAKAEKALEALKKLASPHAIVRRGGSPIEIAAEEVVPGDIVLIDAGRVLPCDLRFAESVNLKVEESSLTGESVPVEKDADLVIADGKAALGDRRNMGFLSTTATYGRGVGIAVATGMRTEIGAIAGMLGASSSEPTPLQKKLDEFGKRLGAAILILCGVMFAVEVGTAWARLGKLPSGKDIVEFFLEAVSLAVAAIPEGLPAIVTIVLALGVRRMIAHNAIVRRLPAVETLGSVNVICSDKTGTLTMNRMRVVRSLADGYPADAESGNTSGDASGIAEGDAEALDPAANETHRLLLECISLCNDASLGEGCSSGDPTEVALLELASRHGVRLGSSCPPSWEGADKAIASSARLAELPFDSGRKLMTTVHALASPLAETNGKAAGAIVFTKGAPDVLLGRCTKLRWKGRVEELTEAHRERILADMAGMSRDALRVLGAAYRVIEAAPKKGDDLGALEGGLVFLGLVGMIDPPRLEVKDSIASCRKSGIATVMITGDHRDTAFAIAKELGIASSPDEVLSGVDLDAMEPGELAKAVRKVRVFARVSPEHKVRIVEAFKANGNIVSMTGDGVNDAPSLEAADIGVAMGITGTDVAKGAADMVLVDDNFKTIVAAIAEGRNIYDNIRKAILFLLSCNAGEILAIFGAILVGWEPPLLPIHILWVNLVTDVLPALALGVDPGDPDAMKRQPRDPRESLFARGGARFTLLNGAFIGLLTIGIYRLAYVLYPVASGIDSHAQTMAFAVLSISQLIHAFNLRNQEKSIFRIGPFSNPWLVGALGSGLALQCCVILIPGLARLFKVTPLSGTDWLLVAAFSLAPLVVNEIAKLIARIGRARKVA
jgi:Ca2+-transporting ATPase